MSALPVNIIDAIFNLGTAVLVAYSARQLRYIRAEMKAAHEDVRGDVRG